MGVAGATGGGLGGAQVSATNGLLATGIGIGVTSFAGAGGTAGFCGAGLLAAGAVSSGVGFSSSSGSHPVFRDLLAAICSNPPVRQSLTLLFGFLVFAAETSSSSPVPSGLQAAGSSSASSDSVASSRSRQSCSIANSGAVVVAKRETSSAVSAGVSNRLPNGCALESISSGSGFGGISSTKLTLLVSGVPSM